MNVVVDVEQVVRENIERTFHMSLGTCSAGRPWVCEVHFCFDDQLNLYFRSLSSTRHCQEIASNPHVAGNIIDKFELGAPIVGLYFEGVARRVTNREEAAQAFTVMQKRQNLKPEALDEALTPSGHHIYKISVSEWSVFGRFGADHSQKVSLKWPKS